MSLPAAIERWRALAIAEAAAAGAWAGVRLPAELVLAVIAVESSGNPSALRHENNGTTARGLMQVTEPAAADVGIPAAVLMDPVQGIRAGARYLARQLRRYGGRVEHAAAAYNAGSARVGSSGRFVNQSYVDRVAAWLARTGAPVAGAVSSSAPWLAIAGLGLVALMVSRRRRAA